MKDWTFAQKALLILASLELLWALAGFAIFHLATAIVFSIVAAIQLRRDRIQPAPA